MIDAEAAARLCESLARKEGKKANENRRDWGKRKLWLTRRRAFLDAAKAIRAMTEAKDAGTDPV